MIKINKVVDKNKDLKTKIIKNHNLLLNNKTDNKSKQNQQKLNEN